MLLDAAQINVPVLALHRLDRLQRLLSEPRRNHLHIRPVLERHLEDRRDRFLHRHLDMLPCPVAKLCERRGYRRSRAMHSALVSRLMPRGLQRWQLWMLGAAAVQDAHTTRAPDRQILGAVVAIRTRQSER